MRLKHDFFQDKDVVELAKKLLGKRIVTKINGTITSGIIIETEAYEGVTDRASHAYGGRLTERTKTLYEQGGVAYVYLCYGIHHLFNFVTNQKGIPHAILLRAIRPEKGIEHMLKRRRKKKLDKTLCAGPGSTSQALGITTDMNGVAIGRDKVWVEETGIVVRPGEIIAGPRIGVEYAGKDAKLPYRFRLNSSRI